MGKPCKTSAKSLNTTKDTFVTTTSTTTTSRTVETTITTEARGKPTTQCNNQWQLSSKWGFFLPTTSLNNLQVRPVLITDIGKYWPHLSRQIQHNLLTLKITSTAVSFPIHLKMLLLAYKLRWGIRPARTPEILVASRAVQVLILPATNASLLHLTLSIFAGTNSHYWR